METRAPAVVAVVVTTGPAPHLSETLASLGSQDYDQCSVLVLVNGESEGLAEQVSATLPSAFVRVLDENRGYPAACNEVIGMVEGAAFLCFCHDDVVLAPDAIHLMVQEAFRSNAGIVAPMIVRPEDHAVLLHLGLNADRFGATTERVEPGEINQGQHDSVRDVFVAPGGCTLVRSDLFETLGGYDPSMVALGEDLDFCWRAQVAGSRVIVCPDAVVAHYELLASGARPLTAPLTGHGGKSLQSLTRRNRLSTMLTCYGRFYLLPTVLLLLVLEVGEVVVAAFGRDRERVGAIVGSWRWCLSRTGEIRRRHKQLAKMRVLDDHDVRRLQIAGASRLSTFGSRLVHEGMDSARGALSPAEAAAVAAQADVADATVGFGAAFSDDESFDELDDLGRRETTISVRFLSTFRTQVAAVVVMALLFAIGVRNLVAAHLPLVGRLAPLDSWWVTWRHFFSTWSAVGVGTGAPSMPGYGVLGFAGTFVLGRMGVLPRAALVLAIPLGTYGMWRLLKPLGSNRARLVGAVAFLCLGLGPNLVAAGRIDVLVALAAMPFLVRRLLVAAGVAPFADEPAHGSAPLFAATWRQSRTGQLVLLGSLEAVVAALDPAAAVAFVVAAVGIAIGGLLAGDRGSGRTIGVACIASVIAAALLLPMTLDTIFAGSQGLDVFGAASGPWSLPGIGGLIRFAIGPVGEGWLSWLLPAAALLPLIVGRSVRFVSAARFAGMGIAALFAAELVARHLTGSFAPDVSTMLVPYAVAVAALVGLGVASFEEDVVQFEFGWRQALSGTAMAVVLLGLLPFLPAAVVTGRFNLPQRGFETQFGFLAVPPAGGNRTLWIGDPRALPLDSWSVEPGLAFATSTNGLPGGGDLFVPPSPGAAHVLSDDIVTAMDGETVQLGRLLAAAGITNVIVVTATAPTLAGLQQSIPTPPPAALLPALRHQQDLAMQPAGGGAVEFANRSTHGVTSNRMEAVPASATPGSLAGAVGWTPSLDPLTGAGPVRAGTLYAGLAPAGDFAATVNGTAMPRGLAFGWAPTWQVQKGEAQITLDAFPINGLLAALVLALWIAIAVSALGADRFERLGRLIRGRGRTRDDAASVTTGEFES
jgi:GT2 family glycosyltransferase